MKSTSHFSAGERELLAKVLKNQLAAVLEQIEATRPAAEVLGEALVLAAWKGKEELAQALLDAGAPIDSQGYGGKTPLVAAFGERKLRIVRLLLERGAADPGGEIAQALDQRAEDKKLFLAVKKQDASSIATALNEGANLIARDGDGETVLRAAARRGSVEVIRFLLDQQAPGKEFDRDEIFTAYLLARDHEQAAKLLVERLAILGITEDQLAELEFRHLEAVKQRHSRKTDPRRQERDAEIYQLITAR